MKKLSILSEKDPIQFWLDTPIGYYAAFPDFGNNLYHLLFKNSKEVKSKLNKIIDKINIDLGYEIASTIYNIRLLATEEMDEYFIVIEHKIGEAVAKVE